MDSLLLIVFVLGVYFIPWFVALSRAREPVGIFLLNLFLGWTLVGWVVALVWASTGQSNVLDRYPPPKMQAPPDTQPAPKLETTPKPAALTPDMVAAKRAELLSKQETRISGRVFGLAKNLGLVAGAGTDSTDPDAQAEGNFTQTEPAAAHITYRDESGKSSARVITIVRGPKSEEDMLIGAYCHMRASARTFRIDRIETLTDVTTGEVRDTPAHIEQWIRDRAPADLAPALDGLTCLSFIAAADDHISDIEILAMTRYATAVVPRLQVPADFAQRIKRFAPTSATVLQAFENIRSSPHVLAFHTALETIILADERVDPAEKAALAFLKIDFEEMS